MSSIISFGFLGFFLLVCLQKYQMILSSWDKSIQCFFFFVKPVWQYMYILQCVYKFDIKFTFENMLLYLNLMHSKNVQFCVDSFWRHIDKIILQQWKKIQYSMYRIINF